MGREVGLRTGGTEVPAVCNRKALCHSHNVWGNEMNSLLASSSLLCQRTLCYQHRWSVHGSGEEPGANYKQVPVNTNESPRTQTLAVKWQFWKLHRYECVPVVLSNQMYCQDSDSQFGSPTNHRDLAATFLWERSRRHSPCAAFFFPPSF